jgi:hypothetical protein
MLVRWAERAADRLRRLATIRTVGTVAPLTGHPYFRILPYDLDQQRTGLGQGRRGTKREGGRSMALGSLQDQRRAGLGVLPLQVAMLSLDLGQFRLGDLPVPGLPPLHGLVQPLPLPLEG